MQPRNRLCLLYLTAASACYESDAPVGADDGGSTTDLTASDTRVPTDDTTPTVGADTTAGPDADADGVDDTADNCPDVTNPDQADLDRDGEGDVCDDDLDGDEDPNETDCAAEDATVHAGADEICDGLDNDCDGVTDPADAGGCTDLYEDADGDGFGIDGTAACLCAGVGTSTAEVAGDCDDDNAEIHPDASELCNGIDDDCSGTVDELWPDLGTSCDGPDPDVCEDGVFVCLAGGSGSACGDGPDTPGGVEVCNGADDDCDGTPDDPWAALLGTPCDGVDADQCANGQYVCAADGSDVTCAGDANVVEVCNGADDDCDGVVDEGCDDDGDDYCDQDATIVGNPATCDPGLGLDCNDDDPAVHPGAVEVCNGIDDDCDGDLDGDDPGAAWPGVDSYEPNEVYFLAPEIVEDADAGVPFGPSAPTWFHNSNNPDYFMWDDFPIGEFPPMFVMCQVTDLPAAATVDIELRYRRSQDPALPYVYDTHDCIAYADAQTCSMPVAWPNPTAGPSQYQFIVGVSPNSGIDACDNDYVVQCRLDFIPIW